MITQVRVDADDPAFDTPSKPIGHFYDKRAGCTGRRKNMIIS